MTKQMQSEVPTGSGQTAEQTVAISHYRNEDFVSGLRSYAQYRDLGMVEATGGMVRAHVLRFTEPCDPKVVSKLHFHDTQFQMVYVLQGLGENQCSAIATRSRCGRAVELDAAARHPPRHQRLFGGLRIAGGDPAGGIRDNGGLSGCSETQNVATHAAVIPAQAGIQYSVPLVFNLESRGILGHSPGQAG